MSNSLEDSIALNARLQSLGFEKVEFEPKISNRFIVFIDNFPSYVIKGVDLPKLSNYGWGAIRLECYNPLGAKLEQAVMDLVKRSEVKITIKLLGPVGNVDTTWNLTVETGVIDFGNVNWSDKSESNLIYINFDVKEATISY